MPAYSYRALTSEGKMIDGTMEASDDGAVSLKLQEMGLMPIRVGAGGKKSILSREIELPWKRKRVRRKDLMVLAVLADALKTRR